MAKCTSGPCFLFLPVQTSLESHLKYPWPINCCWKQTNVSNVPRGLSWDTESSNYSGLDSCESSVSAEKHEKKRNPLQINGGPIPNKCPFQIKYEGTTCEGEPAEELQHIFAEQPFIDERIRGGFKHPGWCRSEATRRLFVSADD